MIRLTTLLAALSLCACGQTHDRNSADSRQSLASDLAPGRTYDNPFGGNAAVEDNAAVADNVEAATDPMTETPTDPVAEPEPVTPATIPMSPPASSCDDGKRVCGDMDSCEDAQFHLQQCGMRRLDGDSDGTPCEKICG